MISLKQLFWLMGTVTTLMIAALLYSKLGAKGHVSFGEVRAIDRLCQRQADGIMRGIIDREGPIKDEATFLKRVHHCLTECRAYLVTSRAKGGVAMKGELKIPACLPETLRQQAARAAHPHVPSTPQVQQE